MLYFVLNGSGDNDKKDDEPATVAVTTYASPTDPNPSDDYITVPSVIGLDSKTAFNALTDRGLIYTPEFEYSDTVPEGYVIKQTPTAGTNAVRGDTVKLIVSNGAKPIVTDPPAPPTEAPRSSYSSDTKDRYNLRASERYISRSDISWMSLKQIQFAINEIYAKHGFEFTKEPYKSEFGAMDWYNPDTNDMNTVSKRMNKYEDANLKVMGAYRNALDD